MYAAVVFVASLCFLIFHVFFISIRARCNWPQLLRGLPANVLSVCLFVCLFVFGEANKIRSVC